MSIRRALQSAIFIIGVTSMTAQIIFLREFLIVFYGNEISIGIILASWLLWGAFGSLVLGMFVDRIKGKVRLLAFCHVSLLFILPVTFFFVRSSKFVLGALPGEIIGYAQMILISFTGLSIVCAMMGFLLSLSTSAYRALHENVTKTIANVYLFESLGAMLGGVLFSFLLVKLFDPADIVFCLAVLNALTGLLLFYLNRVISYNSRFPKWVLPLIVGVLVLWALGGDGYKRTSIGMMWKNIEVIGSENSVYGNITVARSNSQRTFYENGLNLYTVPDVLTAEEAVHFAFLEHGSPRNVLMIGGGIGGLIEQALKYPVERIDYVEIDPVLIKVAKEYLSTRDLLFLEDRKVRIINEDGRAFIKNSVIKYDCVIIQLGDPYTAQLNRFYTVEFYQALSRILNKNAVVSFGLTSSENYIGEESRTYLGSIRQSLEAVFSDLMVIPGDTAYFIASNAKNVISRDYAEIEKRRASSNLYTRYIRDSYLFSKMSLQRIAYANEKLADDKAIKVNRDFAPMSYYYAMLFWSSQFDMPVFKNVMKVFTDTNVWKGFLLILIFLAVYFAFSGKRRFPRAVLIAVISTGFTGMVLQILVMITFQIVYGFMYYQLGIMMTAFMAGFAIGASFAAKTDIGSERIFRKMQFVGCLCPPALYFAAAGLSLADSSSVLWVGANVVFPLISLTIGSVGGVQFPLASKIYRNDMPGRIFGFIYGIDLIGACAGALLASTIFIPLIGISGTCVLLTLLNVLVLLGLNARSA